MEGGNEGKMDTNKQSHQLESDTPHRDYFQRTKYIISSQPWHRVLQQQWLGSCRVQGTDVIEKKLLWLVPLKT